MTPEKTEDLVVRGVSFTVDAVKALLSISIMGVFKVIHRIFVAVKNDIQSEKA